MKKYQNAKDAIAAIQSNQRIFVHGAAATPSRLLKALVEDASRLRNVELFHLHTIGEMKYADPAYRASFKVSAFFVGANMREKLDPGHVDYIPCFLSEIPQLLRSGKVPIDVALIQVSPPDQHGFCTLGTSVDAARAAVDAAKVIIAQINLQMPRVHGDGFIHVDQIHHAIEVDSPLPEVKRTPPTAEETAIGRFASGIIEDGSTLQMGIGTIPDAVLAELKGHRHLGIHTEMWSDGALELIRCGVVDNSQKKMHPGRTVSSFIMGSKRLYDFVHDNPSVVGLDVGYVNSPINIARNPKVVAINSAVEIDLTGQVCADSIGPRVISGAGGQIDFMRGASLSIGGKPIIALTSKTRKGISRIVPMLKQGAGVVTTRAHVHYVITEHGVVDLYGLTLAQRAKALISIAHPEEREKLEKAWREIWIRQ
ncbi:MAG: acetyl-CoA hydrolase/transferase C-terminal domain-containing protein [Bdellovibrionota bacterium]